MWDEHTRLREVARLGHRSDQVRSTEDVRRNDRRSEGCNRASQSRFPRPADVGWLWRYRLVVSALDAGTKCGITRRWSGPRRRYTSHAVARRACAAAAAQRHAVSPHAESTMDVPHEIDLTGSDKDVA